MLDNPCLNAGIDFFMLLPFFVHIRNADVIRAFHVLMDAGNAEAAFIAADFIPPAFGDMCIDKGFAETCAVGVHFCEGIAIHDEKADVASDLRGCQPDAVCLVHGLEHVGDELCQARIIGGDVFRDFT